MDKIIIEDLEVYAYHGVAREEKKLGQMFIISLQIGLDLETAALTGELGATVNYFELCGRVKEIMLSESFDLIESSALKVIEGIFRNYPQVQTVKVLLKKPWAPMGEHLKYAAVELERSRGDRDEW